MTFLSDPMNAIKKPLGLNTAGFIAWIALGIITSLLTSFLMAHYFTKL